MYRRFAIPMVVVVLTGWAAQTSGQDDAGDAAPATKADPKYAVEQDHVR